MCVRVRVGVADDINRTFNTNKSSSAYLHWYWLSALIFIIKTRVLRGQKTVQFHTCAGWMVISHQRYRSNRDILRNNNTDSHWLVSACALYGDNQRDVNMHCNSHRFKRIPLRFAEQYGNRDQQLHIQHARVRAMLEGVRSMHAHNACTRTCLVAQK